MPWRTIAPEHTAYSGEPPGAAMSTPSSSDHVAGGDASPDGIGKVKFPLDDRPAPPVLAGDCAATSLLSCERSDATCARAAPSFLAAESREWVAAVCCSTRASL